MGQLTSVSVGATLYGASRAGQKLADVFCWVQDAPGAAVAVVVLAALISSHGDASKGIWSVGTLFQVVEGEVLDAKEEHSGLDGLCKVVVEHQALLH